MDILWRTVGPGLGMTGVRFMAELIFPVFETDAEDGEVEVELELVEEEFVEEDEEWSEELFEIIELLLLLELLCSGLGGLSGELKFC